jgi:hypothetical protein
VRFCGCGEIYWHWLCEWKLPSFAQPKPWCLESDRVEMAVPKGPNSAAQGEALGALATLEWKPRRGVTDGPMTLQFPANVQLPDFPRTSVSPFQGFCRDISRVPRAAPWAVEFGPFGAMRVWSLFLGQ